MLGEYIINVYAFAKFGPLGQCNSVAAHCAISAGNKRAAVQSKLKPGMGALAQTCAKHSVEQLYNSVSVPVEKFVCAT